MPLFTQRESRPAWFHETDQSQWLRPGLGDYLGAAAGDAWEGLPTVALGRLGEMAALSAQATGTDVELDENGTPVISHERQPMSILPTEEQASIIDAYGLKGQITPQPGYSRDMLDVVMERKKAELARQATREAAPGIYAPLGFATELGISLFDPINVASAFVPVVGEARVLSMLGRASGALGRAGVRAGVGTVEGAVGAAMIEPVIALAQTQQQADYDMSDALGNIAFGAAFGAALHPAAGAVGDWLRSRRGQRQPWQIMPDTDESLALMRRHRDAIRDARIFAGADEARAAEESAAAAALFDARARRWAYDFNQPVAAFYDRYMPDYRAEMAPFDRTVDNFLSTPESLDQTAYHGTPHRFTDFSLEHIGTGEGAQAHGWGLYFAQDRKISEDYRNRLRTGRSRGQLFEVDIPENDVLLDEQKSFGEQPNAVKQALLAVYKSFPKERLAIVREEAKAQVWRDRALVEKGDKLELERQQLFNRKRALKTVNAERPAGTNPFDPKSSAKLFDLGRDYLRQMYSPEQIARLENDAGYLAAEKAALKEKLDDVARKIGENERRIEEKRKKDRDAIDRARLGTLLAKMDGASLYSGISAMADSPRAASELLNAHGVRGITYDGGQDGRSFVVFDDKAIDVLKTFYQPEVDAVPYPNNGRAVGSISPEIASTLRLDKPGAIVLDDIGLQHIEDRHGKEIRGLGFADARAFVDAVLADVSAVYDVDGGGRKYDLVSRTMTPQGRVMVRLEFAETGDFYSIATAGTVRKKYYEKKLPLWESANLNHSPKGTPDATFSGQSGMRQDAAGKISLAIGNREVNGDARARVTFDAAEGGRAIIEFFSAADASSAPHELYHIFRREMAESAARPDAPQRVREDWARIEEFVGAEPGQTWTRAMEEKFARAGERFLLEGKAPTPALQGVFERLRQWFLELYANADAAGLHISPAMREVFGNMLSVPAEQGDMAFRKALGELLSRPVDPVEPAAVPPLPADAPPLETMQAMTVEAEQDLGRALGELEQALPGGAANLRAIYDAETALIDADIQKSVQVRTVLEEAARCYMRN
ncbi:hypothetical protein AAAU16_04005 [Desulfovibrio piger]|uniref:hypothetical protein n=1 Tax=Desulfovibrio piger TaxID=901 RepID=UPI0032BF567B